MAGDGAAPASWLNVIESGPGATCPEGVDVQRLQAHVRALEGERHPRSSPAALAAAAEYMARELEAYGLDVERRPFEFGGRRYENIVGSKWGRRPELARVLVGAHFDSVRGSPGADDNASGVAALLEVARVLAPLELDATVELVGFNLEEQQLYTYRVGSRRFAAEARARGVRYAGALVLEMVGYTDPLPGSQHVPFVLFWKRVPRTGTFLAATGDRRSRRLLRRFAEVAARAAPELQVVTFRTPLRGWLVPDTRLSDNASFWDEGYPSLMLTDTAYLRNPHYHQSTDRFETLDFEFLRQVTEAVAAAAAALARARA